jgi:DNA-binding HxlR family transcriptional regulator
MEKVTMPKKSSKCTSDIGVADFCLCPVTGVIDILSKKWALLIIGILGNSEKLRYNEIMKKLDGIGPKTLSDRLKELESEGLISREFFSEIPPRVEYSLTVDGISLREAIIPLMKWVESRNRI